MIRSSFCLFLLTVPCVASSYEALSTVPLVSSLGAQLHSVFPEQPQLAIDNAVASGLIRALGEEGLDIEDVICTRDYSRLCPEGWADAGDGNGCLAPLDYRGTCAPRLEMGGLTAQQKRQQAARCGASYGCLGACNQDASQSCPSGWHEDVNHDCLAPVGYSGQCVGRKSFRGMMKTERHLWAKKCDVTWPCRKSSGSSSSATASGIFNDDCAPNYSGACPHRFTEEGGRCIAPVGFSGKCGFSLSSQYSAEEKAAYAKACLTPWPCAHQ